MSLRKRAKTAAAMSTVQMAAGSGTDTADTIKAAATAKNVSLQFPVKSDNNNEQDGKYKFKLEELFPLIDNNVLQQNSTTNSAAIITKLACPSSHSFKMAQGKSVPMPTTQGSTNTTTTKLATGHGIWEPEIKNYSNQHPSQPKGTSAKHNLPTSSNVLRPNASILINQSSPSINRKPPPPLTPKLKHLKTKSNNFLSNYKTPAISPTKFLPFSQFKGLFQYSAQIPAQMTSSINESEAAVVKKYNRHKNPASSNSSKSKQYNPTTTSTHYLTSIGKTTTSTPNSLSSGAASLQTTPPPLPILPNPKTSSKFKANTTNNNNIKPNKLQTDISKSIRAPTTTTSASTELIATTTEVNLLKLTPRNSNQIKSGPFIDDKPQKTAQNKAVHVCRSTEERLHDPESLYLDNLNLKQFPSIDSAETELKLLSLQNNHIHKIDSSSILNTSAMLSNLLVLDLYNNRIDRISGLHIFNSLKVLLLGKNRIRRIEGLDSLKHLEIIDLHGNQLRYLDNINSLISLRVLNVAGNVIRSIRNFGPYGISSLQELNLKRNNLHNLAGILKMIHLKKICLGNNHIQTISMLNPLKKLQNLVQLMLEPNPICELPDYINQILSLLPNLELLDSLTITNDLRSIAGTWYKKKVIEEQERKREMDKLKLLSICSTRDEVIFKARKRWESLRNYVRQSSLGSGNNGYSEEQSSLLPKKIPSGVTIPFVTEFVDKPEKKFTVELEPVVDMKPDFTPSNVEGTENVGEKPFQEELLSSEEAVPGFNNPEPPKMTTSNSISLPSHPLSQSRANSTKIAIIRPSIRQKITSAIECAEEHPGATVIISENIPVLVEAVVDVAIDNEITASEAQSIIEEDDEEEEINQINLEENNQKFESEPTLLEQEDTDRIKQQIPLLDEVNSSQLKLANNGEPKITVTTSSEMSIPTNSSSRTSSSILRRSLSSNLLLPPLPQLVRKHVPPEKPWRKSLTKKNRSKSSIDLLQSKQQPVFLNDSESTSDIESVSTTTGTVNSEAGSTSTTTATTTNTTNSPRVVKRAAGTVFGPARPKLVRSLSSRNLIKPRGKTARPQYSTSGEPNFGSKRPLTSISSVEQHKSNSFLRRSESASTLELYNNNNNEATLKKQGIDYLIEINGKMLNIYGQGALKHMLNSFSSNSTSVGNVASVTFNFITFDSLIPYFYKMKQIYPALEHFQFRANGLQFLAQLNSLADLQGLTSLFIFPEGNPLVENEFWVEYSIYRLGHWGLQKFNGKEVSNYSNPGPSAARDEELPKKTFESLGYLALSCLPQSALTPLAERLHMLHCFCCCSSTSNSSDDSGRGKRNDGASGPNNASIIDKCTSYWDDDPVLLDVIGKEALVYIPENELNNGLTASQQNDVTFEIFENGYEILEKLNKLEQVWPSLMVEIIEDILLDFHCMDNFMKKELLALKNNLSASSSSVGGSGKLSGSASHTKKKK